MIFSSNAASLGRQSEVWESVQVRIRRIGYEKVVITCCSNCCIAVLLFCSSLALAGTVQLPETGQSFCYDSSGANIACNGTGQDGDWQTGVSWPNPRFTVGTGTQDACVTDNLTGLIWVKMPDSTVRSWQGALDYAKNLNLCGFSDWRVPTIVELESIVNAGQTNPAAWLNMQGFNNVQSGGCSYCSYWSSTTGVGYSPNAGYPNNTALSVDMSLGSYGSVSHDKADNIYTWPVRGGSMNGLQTAASADIWRTGQTKCYDTSTTVVPCTDTGQDGDLLPGVAWPYPRFANNGNGTVIDNLTGLIWMKDANCTETVGDVVKDTGHLTWSDALIWSNNLASGKCGLSDGSQVGDWRLPNRIEILSLVDFEYWNRALSDAAGSAKWNGDPFVNVLKEYYWSSTTCASFTDTAWGVSMWGGGMYNYSKTAVGSTYGVWPVRGPILTISKSGVGTVTSNPMGINCGDSYNICKMQFSVNQGVKLSASSSRGGSIFLKWSGDCDANGNVTMSADKSCTAIFSCTGYPVLVGTTGWYNSISEAYNNPATVSGNTIKVSGPNQQEDVVFELSEKDLMLQGGYDCDFSEPPLSFTTITGSLTISTGSITVDRIVIQ